MCSFAGRFAYLSPFFVVPAALLVLLDLRATTKQSNQSDQSEANIYIRMVQLASGARYPTTTIGRNASGARDHGCISASKAKQSGASTCEIIQLWYRLSSCAHRIVAKLARATTKQSNSKASERIHIYWCTCEIIAARAMTGYGCATTCEHMRDLLYSALCFASLLLG